MPGRLRRSYRIGNLAEHLGLLLLKGIAAVAEVSRTEDVGLDAVASLLRRDDDGNLYAEDTFAVQLKSESATAISYDEHGLDWLLGQSVPMFIGLVSLEESRLSLYSTLNINAAVLALHARHVTVRFGNSNLPAFILGARSQWTGGEGDSATVWLGHPLLEWTAAQLAQSRWADMAYDVLKRFLVLARRELELLSLGQCSFLDWSTNDRDSIRATSLMMKGHSRELAAVAERCLPGLRALLMNSITLPDQSASEVIGPAVGLVAALRKLGVDVDPENLLSTIFRSQLTADTDAVTHDGGVNVGNGGSSKSPGQNADSNASEG